MAVTAENLENYLGVPKFRYGEAETEDQVGVVTGLAWTEVGGELLTIEAVVLPGKGKMTVTGNLKDVMKESISAAASYVRSRAVDFGIEPPLYDRRDIHVHVPEGATPKDGPSAGVAMATSIVSVMTGIPIRRDIAMTGEITLRGRVLPIGGLKEKLLAALRGGLKKVLIPEENAKDLAEIPNAVKNALEIVPVSRMDEVLSHALVRQPTPIQWEEDLGRSQAPGSGLGRRRGRRDRPLGLQERRTAALPGCGSGPCAPARSLARPSQAAYSHRCAAQMPQAQVERPLLPDGVSLRSRRSIRRLRQSGRRACMERDPTGPSSCVRHYRRLEGGDGMRSVPDSATFFGRLAQPVEHLVYTERVGGSNPSPPTRGLRSIPAPALPQRSASGASAWSWHGARALPSPRPRNLCRSGRRSSSRPRACKRNCDHGLSAEVISATGEITNSSADEFLAFLNEHVQDQQLRPVILIHSPGGTVVGSMQLGMMFRKLGAAVIVARTVEEEGTDRAHVVPGACMSACVYAFMGGAKRVVPTVSRLGIHRMAIYGQAHDPAGGEVETRSYRDRRHRHGSEQLYQNDGGQPRGDRLCGADCARSSIHIVTPREIARWRLGSSRL